MSKPVCWRCHGAGGHRVNGEWEECVECNPTYGQIEEPMTTNTYFMQFWRNVNKALESRGQAPMLFGEAWRRWSDREVPANVLQASMEAARNERLNATEDDPVFGVPHDGHGEV